MGVGHFLALQGIIRGINRGITGGMDLEDDSGIVPLDPVIRPSTSFY